MKDSDTGETAPAGGRHLIRHGPSRRWMIVFCALLAVSVAGALALTYAGIKTVRASRAGQAVSTVTDPAAPGFEAFLEPTPTLAILHRDGKHVRSIAVVSLNSGDVGGSLLLVSPHTYGDEGDPATFGGAAAFSGQPEATLSPLQPGLGFGITEFVLVDDARWTEVVGPVSPLQVDNPSAVAGFPAGRITLPAEQVGAYLAATNPGESPRESVLRQRAFYRAWLDAVAASGDVVAAVPGEVDSGLGRFMRGLAAGPHRVETAPVVEKLFHGFYRTDMDATAMAALVPELVPFPTAGEPGGRVRVRLLDGSGDAKHVQRVAPLVIPADAEIVVVGNADAFDYQETEIRYHNPLAKAAARTFQDALGAGRLVDDPRQTDTFDVTIVLGTDI